MNENKLLKIKELTERIHVLEKENKELELKYKKLLFMFQPEYYRLVYPNDTDEDIKNILGLFKE